MGDYARRDRKGEKTTDATIVEEQLILRVPPAIAEIVRQGCRGKGELELSFSMESERKGEMMVGEKRYNVTLVDLPCVIDTHKTLDRRTFYKSGDIHQMLLVEDPNAPEKSEKFQAKYDHDWRLDSGLTRLTRHIRTERWRRQPGFSKAEVEKVADELQRMKRGGPVPDRYEYVEVTEAMIHPPEPVAMPAPKPAPSPVVPPATTTPSPIAKPAPATPNTPSTPQPVVTTTPGPLKAVFKFAKKSEPGTPSTPTITVTTVPSTTQAVAGTTAQTPLPIAVPSMPVQAPSNAMDVDVPLPATSPAIPQPSTTPQPLLPPQSLAPPMSASPAPGNAEYEQKVAQRAALARQKVSEESQLAKLNISAQSEKNMMMRARILQNVATSQAKIKKLDEQLADIDRVLHGFGI